MHRVIHRSWGVPAEYGHESRFQQWKCLVFEESGRFMLTQGEEQQRVKYFFFRSEKYFPRANEIIIFICFGSCYL